MEGIKPDFLKKGDKVCIVSTARKVSEEEILPAVQVLTNWGLEVLLGDHLYSIDHQFAGTDQERLADIQSAMDDREIKAIFCARGGYGTPRIMDDIQWEGFLNSPKWIIAFSDMTGLLTLCLNKGICSLHAAMPLFFDKPAYSGSVQALRNYLFGGELAYSCEPHYLNRRGKNEGILVGGNLSMVVNNIGTGSAFDPKGKILVVEDIDEYLYHIDRMMVQLKRTGVLKELSGLVVGHFSDMKDNAIPFGENANEIIARNVSDYSFPVMFGFPAGHAPQNMPLPIGAKLKLNVDKQGSVLDFS
jgi:muramoyltetrapeptide carboxypeptidase